ncbi:hypothetical protein [Lentzea sp. NPDC004782]|uniref:WXG100 family type VII secretion target n=1 Tax=Lentzea sp. NPDC004782 TaxID=3154458 RepID=UPI0033B97CCB
MKITEENKLKGSLFIEAYGSLIDGIGKDAESETEKALDITFNAIGAASSTVMLAIDPLGSIIGAGVGWLIEHVSFLRDALNQLMGNPEEIQANVEATKKQAADLRVLAEDHKNGLATFDGWTGQSSEAFKRSMDGMSQELDDLANAVETKAKIVAIMGMLVTVLRDIVRDLISQLIGGLIGGAILAAAAMIPTFGASIPAFIGFAVGKAVALGVNIASRVARVVAALGRQMKRIGDLDGIMAKISKGWERFENSADAAEIGWEAYKAQKDVDKKIDEAVAGGGSGGGGGNTPPGASGGKTAQDVAPSLPNALRVGTVQTDGTAAARVHAFEAPAEAAQPMHTVSRHEVNAAEPMQAVARHEANAAEPMQALRRVEAVEPLQPMHAASRMEAVEPMQPLQRMEAVHAPMAPVQMNAEPAQPLHRMEALQPMQAAQRVEAPMAPMQPLHRMEAVEAPMAQARVEATPMHENLARTASDSTMVSGVSMTSGTPVHQAVQPIQAHEMYNSVDTNPAEPLQSATAFEQPMGPQMSHTFEAPARENYNPLQAYSAADPVQESYNPLVGGEPIQQAAAYETPAQSGGAPVQPLRPAVSHERPNRQPE